MQWFLCLFVFSFYSMAALKYPSDRLKVMDVETLQRIVNTNLSQAQQALHSGYNDVEPDEDEDVSEYGQAGGYSELTQEEGAKLVRESLELVFAIPEQTGATSSIYSTIEGVALEYGGIYSFLEDITHEALKVLGQKGKDKSLLRDQNTYTYILNNMMAEIKPLALSEEGKKYKELIEKIRDENLRVSDALKSYRILNSMSKVVNPSKVAEQIVGKRKCSWWEFWC